jgi:predicted TIM-barrel fold metal-dependent hydrolase
VNGALIVQSIESEEFINAMRLMAALDLELDVNGATDPMIIAKLADKISELRIVINHCGNCGDAQKLTSVWKDGMAASAKHKNVWCKVSALIEFNGVPWGKAPTDTAYYQPVLDHLWEHFGADRLIYASNWPVSDRGGSYDIVFKIVSDYFQPKGSEVCEKFFWKNSLAAYKWIERK